MTRLLVLVLTFLLSGCGLGETAGTAATIANMKAQEAKQGQAAKEQIVNQLEQANQQAARRTEAAAQQQ